MPKPSRMDAGDFEVDGFVEANLISFASWDLVIYLARNPSSQESLPQLASVLARHESDLLPAIDVLVANGVLDQIPGDPPCYALRDDPKMRDVVERFISLAGKRDHRLDFVRRVLGHMTLP